MSIVLRRYTVQAPVRMRIALLSDLHGRDIPDLYENMAREKPDVICLSGDMLEYQHEYENEAAVSLMERLGSVARTLYVTGNHDRTLPGAVRRRLRRARVMLMDGACTEYGGVWFGGLASEGGAGIVERLAKKPGFRVLLCHHPEYYEPLVQGTNVDLMLSGHAHGGQWRLGSRGLYAPGQGIWPRYTGGVYKNRLIVSRGLANTTWIPRLGNPREWNLITLQ